MSAGKRRKETIRGRGNAHQDHWHLNTRSALFGRAQMRGKTKAHKGVLSMESRASVVAPSCRRYCADPACPCRQPRWRGVKPARHKQIPRSTSKVQGQPGPRRDDQLGLFRCFVGSAAKFSPRLGSTPTTRCITGVQGELTRREQLQEM